MRYLALLLLLSACDTLTLYKPVPVNVPVSVPCVTPKIEEPKYPRSTLTDSLFTKIKNRLTELELRRSYEAKLAAAVKACQ